VRIDGALRMSGDLHLSLKRARHEAAGPGKSPVRAGHATWTALGPPAAVGSRAPPAPAVRHVFTRHPKPFRMRQMKTVLQPFSTAFSAASGRPLASFVPRRSAAWVALAAAVAVAALSSTATACPFCESVQQTIRQQSETMDAVVIGTSLDGELTRNLKTGAVKMKAEKVLKGDEHVDVGQSLDAIYYGKVEVGRRFLLSGVDPPNMQWSCLPITETAEEYIVNATKVADDPVERLKFYMDYLEHEEPLISRDAYDEFASSPYDVISQLESEMDREQLIQWVGEPDIGADRKRLYFTMLGVCGQESDLPMLEKLLRDPPKSVTGSLDALIACYLTLAGEKGLPLITERFIANKKAPFPQSYAAIMAIRFHGTEGEIIPRSALVESLHHVLDRTELADMVIPDLAKWKDWSQIDRLVTLFKDVEKDKNWLRVPSRRAMPSTSFFTA